MGYDVPEPLLERVRRPVRDAQEAYLAAEMVIAGSAEPNVPLELLNFTLHQLAHFEQNPMRLYIHEEDLTLRDPIGRLRTFCIRTAAAEQRTKTAKRSSSRGRPETDPTLSRRIREAWITGRYKRYADLARELGVTAAVVKLAVDRTRKKKS